ncbi:MAG: formylglycine-generating enzyme family protein [Reichenbachiella sp.]|uniref:formylglycine-generating enzyme family protein n=1 Tax=Reichenbachiella sp. TaxID=2184521 RepID=UPI002966D82F|nr:formylglycine-generating enzyme family protein [Reichenbachiella sp.]MDW3210948.1 formylglycine-generating enzyme family protein [Reichenbachiella sp.]
MKHILFALIAIGTFACSTNESKQINTPAKNQVESNVPEGMVFVPGGTFVMGNEGEEANAIEGPEFTVELSGFYMDITEVTNAQFQKFVDATGYQTIAERPIDWEELKKQLPEGVEKPADSLLKPGSLVFAPIPNVSNLYDISQWWAWQTGSDWRHPYGPESNIEGKENHPVVHIAHEDAEAYATWAGKRLPTEAEWEYASRGGSHQSFAWGEELTPEGQYLANFFQGTFPGGNTIQDGFEKTAPVKSYPPNAYGLYDMIGNVWEWTSDWFRPDSHLQAKSQTITICRNPKGPESSFDPQEPQVPKRVIKGGSFLCSDQYCSNYRPSARMATAIDSGQEHLGFRCVQDVVN